VYSGIPKTLKIKRRNCKNAQRKCYAKSQKQTLSLEKAIY
jgi:hypothetical protein